MNVQEQYKRVCSIWENAFGNDSKVRLPLVPLPPKPDCLLFVGLNPSFNVGAIRRWLAEKGIKKPNTYFLWKNREKFDPQVDVCLHKRAKEEYPYFMRFRVLSSMVGVDWDHIDICFYRESSQAEVRKQILITGKGSTYKLTDFGQKQFNLSMRLIEEAKPRCIIVANAFASHIYESENGLEFSTSRGCYLQVMRNTDLTVPVFLSSMLTGQRALDNYSLERLAWHICRELGKPLNITKQHNQTSITGRRKSSSCIKR